MANETYFDERISRLPFELRLASDFGRDVLTREESSDGLSCYYRGNEHVGSWINQRGWIFEQS